MPPAPPDRRADLALGVLVGVLLAVAGLRGFGDRAGLRPTDHRRPVTTADLNTADRAELLQVPGVGPKLADAIVTHRSSHRFASLDELDEVKGVGPATLDKLRPFVSVDGSVTEAKPLAAKPGKLKPGDPPVDVNAATEAELQRLPGVGVTLAGRIVLARGTERFKSPDDLRRVKGIGAKTLDSLRPFVVCR